MNIGSVRTENSNYGLTRQCVILAGGFGTRLGELTKAMPKPLLPIEGRPFLDFLVSEAIRRGFNRFLFLAGHASTEIEAFIEGLSRRYKNKAQFDISIEPTPLGTGGALIHALPKLEDRFLLLNGDTWFDFNWLDIVSRAVQSNLSMVAARNVPLADRYESFKLWADGIVEKIVPRGSKTEPALINAGVYILRKVDLLGFSGKISLEDTILPTLVERRALGAQCYNGFFVDIGIPTTYKSAQNDIPARLRRGALFLDRDGVLNHDDNYVHRVEQIRWIDGARDAIKHANDIGLYVFIVTNQAGVARGYYGEEDVQVLHRWMTEQIRASGAHIDDWRYCPHHPDATIERYRGVHSWRKPAPGMILDLASHWPVDLANSLLIGDQLSDLAAAEAAGISGSHFAGGNLHEFLLGQLARCGKPS